MLIKRTERQTRRGNLAATVSQGVGGLDRRSFLRKSGLVAGGLATIGALPLATVQKAEAAGLEPGTSSRSSNMAAGAALGVVAGAAVGASTGLIGGPTGVAIGAAAGGGLGLIIGLAGGAYKPLEPDPPYADTVVRCLIEKGYDVTGWE